MQTKKTDNPAGTEKPDKPYDNQTDNYQQDHYQLFFNHQFNNTLSFNTAVFLTRGRGYYEEYKAGQALADYGLPDITIGNTTITETDLVRQLWLDNYFYGNVTSLQYKKDNNQFTIGGGYTRFDGNHYGLITWSQTDIPKDYKYYDLDARKTDGNIYAKYQHKWNNHLETFADVQYRNIKHTINGFEGNPDLKINQSYNFINPKIGFSYTNKDWLLYASYSLGNKEPNRDDFEAGINQLPKHETLHDFEIGVEKQRNQYSWGATAYYMKYKDQLVLTGKINDVGSYTRTNIPKSYRLGLELQGKAKINSWIIASGNLTLSENKILKFTEYIDDYDNGGQKLNNYSKSDISFSPGIIGAATISVLPAKDLEIDLLSKYVSRQYLDNTSKKSRSLNPYFTEDVRINYVLRKIVFKETNFILQVNNLFNKKYEPNGYTYSYYYGGELATENYYYPMAGTNFMFGINIKL
ncbi:MAG: TonB-dependent receptor [Sphingobacteriales bacterium]